MIQTVTTVAFEVQPGSAGLLEQRVAAMRDAQERDGAAPPYQALRLAVPTLHFMSIMLIRQAHYDPMLLLEVNFDGPPAEFWARFSAALRAELLQVLPLCQPPRSQAARDRFLATVATGDGLAAVLQDSAVAPTASHLGNRGLSRARIEQERELFDAVRDALERDPALRTNSPAETHAALRRQVLPAHPWLAEPVPPRISALEGAADSLRLRLFLAAAAAILVVPGTVVALVIAWWFAALIGVAVALVLARRVDGLRDLLRPAAAADSPVAAPSPSGGIAFLLQVIALGLGLLLLVAFALWLTIRRGWCRTTWAASCWSSPAACAACCSAPGTTRCTWCCGSRPATAS